MFCKTIHNECQTRIKLGIDELDINYKSAWKKIQEGFSWAE